VYAAIDGATANVTSVSVTASTTALIDVVTYGIAGALSAGSSGGFGIAAAGSISLNSIHNTTDARITGSAVNTTGPVTVHATDSSTITADAGGASTAIGSGGSAPTGTGAAAASVSINSVSNTVNAVVDSSTLGDLFNRVASVDVAAASAAKIKSFALVGS